MAATTNPIAAFFAAAWWNILTLVHSGWVFLPWIRPHWTVDQMADQRGRVVVITGGNSGTGYATAAAYYARGARVLLLCRSAERAAAAIADLQRGGVANVLSEMEYAPVDTSRAGTLEHIPCDLADLDSVAAAARAIAARVQRVDVLFANAGIMAMRGRTKQGYPLQFGTNVLGHQRLIALLLPQLRTPRSRPARIITVASAAHVSAPPGGVDYAALDARAARDAWLEYGESKWANIALAKYMHARWGPACADGVCGVPAPGTGEIISVAVHPGIVATNLFMHNAWAKWLSHKFTWALRCVSATAATGALNQIWAAEVADPVARELSGAYVWCYQCKGRERADLDAAAGEKVWAWCETQVARQE
ncbi:NAD(P)-binding protein [Cutaneotrichosporon oleaginosum]|uniref:NAD(P)-binding protein n=1 Tax=Cutaneotrichosporon oleaginosum TaxID=879819 RepID=A0A0J0XWM6_9TREE|nr:NAD(P)-binding protein [Cutaneotrichosporon oleaginosum]KLT45467.1 NAD(P)-binding protein [Cutaneotrichosporon oleaginosum]